MAQRTISLSISLGLLVLFGYLVFLGFCGVFPVASCVRSQIYLRLRFVFQI